MVDDRNKKRTMHVAKSKSQGEEKKHPAATVAMMNQNRE
jgi:hypothetical protein